MTIRDSCMGTCPPHEHNSVTVVCAFSPDQLRALDEGLNAWEESGTGISKKQGQLRKKRPTWG